MGKATGRSARGWARGSSGSPACEAGELTAGEGGSSRNSMVLGSRRVKAPAAIIRRRARAGWPPMPRPGGRRGGSAAGARAVADATIYEWSRPEATRRSSRSRRPLRRGALRPPDRRLRCPLASVPPPPRVHHTAPVSAAEAGRCPVGSRSPRRRGGRGAVAPRWMRQCPCRHERRPLCPTPA
jgi:hypothetical protein